MSWSAATGAELLSSIATWVCPDCGGRMGGRGKEFKCQGECQKDWRETWEQRYRRSETTGRAGSSGPKKHIYEFIEFNHLKMRE